MSPDRQTAVHPSPRTSAPQETPEEISDGCFLNYPEKTKKMSSSWSCYDQNWIEKWQRISYLEKTRFEMRFEEGVPDSSGLRRRSTQECGRAWRCGEGETDTQEQCYGSFKGVQFYYFVFNLIFHGKSVELLQNGDLVNGGDCRNDTGSRVLSQLKFTERFVGETKWKTFSGIDLGCDEAVDGMAVQMGGERRAEVIDMTQINVCWLGIVIYMWLEWVLSRMAPRPLA